MRFNQRPRFSGNYRVKKNKHIYATTRAMHSLFNQGVIEGTIEGTFNKIGNIRNF